MLSHPDYDDRQAPDLVTRRKRALTVGYAMISAAALIFIPIAVWGALTIAATGGEAGSAAAWAAFWGFCGVSTGGFAYLAAVKEAKARLKFGVTLTEEGLSIWGRAIPLNSILWAEVARFRGNPETLLVVTERPSSGRSRGAAIHLLRQSDTVDLVALAREVRKLRGLPEQTLVQSYTRREWNLRRRNAANPVERPV